MSTKSRKRKQISRQKIKMLTIKGLMEVFGVDLQIPKRKKTIRGRMDDEILKVYAPITLTRKSIEGVTITNRKSDDIDMYSLGE